MSVHIRHLMKEHKKQKRERAKTITLVLVILCIFTLPCVIQERWIETDQPYHKELAWIYGTMPLMHYQCYSIRSDSETNETWVYFGLDRFERFSLTSMFCTKDRAAAEIARIQKRTAEYLQDHPESELHDHHITIALQELPGENFELTNYDQETKERYEHAYDISYLHTLSTEHLSAAAELSPMRYLYVVAETADDVTFFADWTDLRYLNIYCKDLTQEQITFLCENLPECEIWINDEQAQEAASQTD